MLCNFPIIIIIVVVVVIIKIFIYFRRTGPASGLLSQTKGDVPRNTDVCMRAHVKDLEAAKAATL